MIAANVNSEWVFCRTHCRKMTNGCLCKDYVMLPLNRGKFYCNMWKRVILYGRRKKLQRNDVM